MQFGDWSSDVCSSDLLMISVKNVIKNAYHTELIVIESDVPDVK